jgi:hypothetical protein
LERLPWGKSSIRRLAIGVQSACAHRPPGNRAINEANLCAAMSFGNADNWEASAQGSTFSRDSAERTLSVIVLSSAPIGA